MDMKALVIQQPGQSTIQQIEMPSVGDNEIRIKVMAAGICGTDVHIYRGEYLGTYPIIPGHEFSGIVDAAGPGVLRFKQGDRVAVEPNISCNNCYACLNNRQNFCEHWQAVGVTRAGGMAQYVVVPENAAFLIGDLSFEEGSFVEPLSCVLHGIERVGIHMGDRILIIGSGPIGNLILQSALLQGAASITVVERNPSRLELAKQYDSIHALSSLDTLPHDYFDVVIDATGVTAMMNRTIDFVRKGGQILLFGVPKKEELFEIPAFQFFEKGVSILTSYTSVRNSTQAVGLLESGRIHVKPLISHQLPLGAFHEGVEFLETGSEGVLKVLLKPWD